MRPGFKLRDRWATREATYRDLTSGRSGLPAYAGDELRAFGYGRGEILRRLRHLRPAAGFRAAYAPQGAVVTAAAVAAEEATGVSWARLVRERVLEPVGDDGTVLTWRGFVRAPDKATPHRLVGGSMVPQQAQDESVFAPALGVSAGLDSLEIFARLQLNGGAVGGSRVAPAGLLEQALHPATAAGSTATGPMAVAPGWMLSSFGGRLLASAEGGVANGSTAVVTLVPDDGVAVIVLANAYPEGTALGSACAHARRSHRSSACRVRTGWGLSRRRSRRKRPRSTPAASLCCAGPGRGVRAALARRVRGRLREPVLREDHGAARPRRRTPGPARPR